MSILRVYPIRGFTMVYIYYTYFDDLRDFESKVI